MIKILFYHCNDTLGVSKDNRQIYLGVSSLYLKTHIDKTDTDLSSQLEWMVPIQQKMSDQNLIDYINFHKPDVFCTSNYIWNHSSIMDQLKNIHDKVSHDICIVSGGPSIDVNIDPDFFSKYPFVDYAIYGAGEVAFRDIISSLLNKEKLIAFNTSNVAWYDANKKKQVVAEFKYVPQLKWSPYLNNVDFFTKIIKIEQDKNISVVLPYDLTRGCPYSCTFCDWNSGLTNKTTRRKGTFKDEIDLFQKLKIQNLYLSDANVGQYDEDIEMISYMAQKNLEEGTNFKVDGNFSKLRKENNLKIYHIMAKSNLLTEYAGFTISVQDTNPMILKNINRPDVGWEVHKQMIRELKECYPNIHSKVQLIQGLPGQTVQSWRNTLKEVSKENLQLQIFISELLSASPAARSQEYKENFNFSYSSSLRFNGNDYYRGYFSESCASFTKKDFVKMTILSHFYTAIVYVKSQWHETFDCETVVDYFLQSEIYQMLEYNLWDNWQNHDKFYYSVNFDGKQQDTSACFIFSTSQIWAVNMKFIRLIFDCLYTKHKAKDIFKKYLVREKDSLKVNIKLLEGYN